MKKSLLIILLCVFAVAAKSQSAGNTNAEPKKCFPSGSSFKQGGISYDEKWAFFTTVNDLKKVFSLETGNIILASKDYKDMMPYYGTPTAVNYKLTKKTTNNRTGEPQTFYVEDFRGKRVSEFEVEKQMREYFDPNTGSLITGKRMHDKIYLIQPNSKPRKILKTGYPYLDDGFVCDKLGHYMIFKTGTIVDLRTGDVRTGEFVVNRKKYTVDVRISNAPDASHYAVNVVDGTIEVHNLPTGKLLKKISPHADLPRLQDMEMLPISPDGDYIYWLNFNNKQAVAGLAYLVRDGVSKSFCDPVWEEESSETYFQTLKAGMIAMRDEGWRKEAAKQKAAQERKEALASGRTDGKTMYQVDNEATKRLMEAPGTPAETRNYINEVNRLVGEANALNSRILASQKSLLADMQANTNPRDLMNGPTLRKNEEIQALIRELEGTYGLIKSKSEQLRQRVQGTASEDPVLMDFIGVAIYNSRNGEAAMLKLSDEWNKIKEGAQR